MARMVTQVGGKTFVHEGSSIQINGNQIIVDGKVVEDKASGIVKLEVQGDLASLTCDASVEVTGNVAGNVDAGNSVHCGHVQGNVDAGNSVHCGNVGGGVDAGNSIYKS